MDSLIRGSVAVLGDFVAADIILPARHSFLPPQDMALHALEELGGDANAKIRAHPILVAGKAFGYGTGRESPARALRACGLRAVVGGPFARMFFRNCLNNGVLTLECPELAASGIRDGDELEISLDESVIRSAGRTFTFVPVAPVVRAIVGSGGLIEYGRQTLAAQEARR